MNVIDSIFEESGAGKGGGVFYITNLTDIFYANCIFKNNN